MTLIVRNRHKPGLLRLQFERETAGTTKKSLIENYITERGHYYMFIPKFHCELNPIERVWGQAKKGILVHIVITQSLV